MDSEPEVTSTTQPTKVTNMDATSNILPLLMAGQNSTPAAGLLGGATGGALVGSLLGGAFTNGVFGGNNNSAATTLQIENAVAASTALSNARFDALQQANIEAAINQTAAATQLAQATTAAANTVLLTKGQGDINTQVALTSGNLGTQVAKTTGDLGTQNALNAAAIQTQSAKQAGDLATQIALTTANVATAVQQTGTATALAFKDSSILAQANTNALSTQIAAGNFALADAVRTQGDRVIQRMDAINDQNLNRMLTTAQNEIIELKGDRSAGRHSKETEVNVTQLVNQNQAQAQQQQQFQVLNTLATGIQALVQQNQTIHQGIVNLGTMSGAAGQQTAANTRVQ